MRLHIGPYHYYDAEHMSQEDSRFVNYYRYKLFKIRRIDFTIDPNAWFIEYIYCFSYNDCVGIVNEWNKVILSSKYWVTDHD